MTNEPSYKTVLVEKRGGIAWVAFNRPTKHIYTLAVRGQRTLKA
jgi:enoyl-CoA hydratase/carnithine racemase